MQKKLKNKRLASILPVFLLISFIWLNLYPSLTGVNDIFLDKTAFMSVPLFLAFVAIVRGAFSYLIFELLFFVYRFAIGFSIYSFMIPKDVLKNKFRYWYIFRNLILGIFYNLRFFFPYVTTFLCIFELILNMAFVVMLYFDLNREYIEPLVGQFVFKTLTVPIVLYEVYKMIVLMWGVL